MSLSSERLLAVAVPFGPVHGIVRVAADAGVAPAAHITDAPTSAPTTAMDDHRRPRPSRRAGPPGGVVAPGARTGRALGRSMVVPSSPVAGSISLPPSPARARTSSPRP